MNKLLHADFNKRSNELKNLFVGNEAHDGHALVHAKLLILIAAVASVCIFMKSLRYSLKEPEIELEQA